MKIGVAVKGGSWTGASLIDACLGSGCAIWAKKKICGKEKGGRESSGLVGIGASN